MPELPEVEAARRLIEAECVGKTITHVDAENDDKVIQGITPQDLTAALLNKTVAAAKRLGKHCYLEFLEGGPALMLHFGMTGAAVVRGRGGVAYQRYTVDDSQWPPRFVKLQLRFADGTQWAFCDSRRFARIRLIQDPLSVPPLSLLGWDPLLNMPSAEDFAAAIAKQRRAIKALLLDQSFSAGVGNWVADECLYQARIHPEQPANTLTHEQVMALHKWIHEVCATAAEVNADADKLPADWLFHSRWGKGSATKSKIQGHTIDHITVGGRTSAYVPALQKLSKAGAGASGASGGGKGGSKRAAVAVESKEEPVPLKKQTKSDTTSEMKKAVVPKKRPAVPRKAQPKAQTRAAPVASASVSRVKGRGALPRAAKNILP